MVHEDAMFVAMANEPDASRRERDAVSRALDTLDDAGWLVWPNATAVVLRDAGSPELPSPRLELRWSDEGDVCLYELVLPLREHDIRRDHAPSGSLALAIGRTTITGGLRNRWGPDGVETPYRDGRHILWDMAQLGLRGFATWRGSATELKADPPPAADPAP